MVEDKGNLCSALRVLAADPEMQVEYLCSVGLVNDPTNVHNDMNIDEIALQFDDVEHIPRRMLNRGEISDRQYALILGMSESLKAISGEDNASLWTLSALKTNEVWVKIRACARLIISDLNCGEDC